MTRIIITTLEKGNGKRAREGGGGQSNGQSSWKRLQLFFEIFTNINTTKNQYKEYTINRL